MTSSPFPHYADRHAYADPVPYGQHPSLALTVTPQQRDRAESFLQEAYAEGRLTHAEFEVRLDQVLTAGTRRDLNEAFYGLVSVDPASQALGLHPAYRPSLVNQGADGRTGRAMAALAHFSAFAVGLFGPLLFFMLASRGTYAKRQAATAFNWQLFSLLGGVGTVVAAEVTGIHALVPLAVVAWFVLTLMGGVKASQGERTTNPVSGRLPWKPLDDR